MKTASLSKDYMGSFWTISGATSARRVVTPTGYVDLTSGHRYWYLTNRQGSTMAVVDETGAIVQRNGYYPSGTPFILPSEVGTEEPPSMTETTDELHIGNRWMNHSGLNMYDNTARLHDPILMRFGSPDPMFGKYPDTSPWTHCSANPLNAIDPLGMDEYVVNANGEIVNQIPNDEKDIITIEGTGNSIEFQKGTVISWKRVANSKTIIKNQQDHKEKPIDKNSDPKHPTIDYLKIRGDDNAVKIFEFVSTELQDQGIEFTMIMTGVEGDKGLNFIGTSHLVQTDNSANILYNGQLKYGYNIRYWIHNHPGNSIPSPADLSLSNQIWKLNPIPIKWGVFTPSGTYKYIPYYRNEKIGKGVSSFKDL